MKMYYLAQYFDVTTNLRWRTAAILKIGFFGHNSAADCPILLKFCVGKHNSVILEIT